jgi:flagellar L-ring protein precursor FlgH
MKTQTITLLLILSIVGCYPLRADSLWKENSAGPYSAQKVHKVGDIVNILILESSSAKNLSGTKTDVKDDLGAKFTHNLARLAPIIGANNQIAGQLSNRYSGDGSTTRSSNVSARIAALVTEVLPNGNLAIKGQHKVEVNDELQEIIITGVVRAKDISGGNTVYSYQVANADLVVKGTGAVSDAGAPGWLTRLLNWLF